LDGNGLEVDVVVDFVHDSKFFYEGELENGIKYLLNYVPIEKPYFPTDTATDAKGVLELLKYRQTSIDVITHLFEHWALMLSITEEDDYKDERVYHIYRSAEQKGGLQKIRYEQFTFNPDTKSLYEKRIIGPTKRLTHESFHKICKIYLQKFEFNIFRNNCQNFCHDIVNKLVQEGYIEENNLSSQINECSCLYCILLFQIK